MPTVAEKMRFPCVAPPRSKRVLRICNARTTRPAGELPPKGNHVAYSSAKLLFRTAVERPHRNSLCSTAVRNGRSVLRYHVVVCGDAAVQAGEQLEASGRPPRIPSSSGLSRRSLATIVATRLAHGLPVLALPRARRMLQVTSLA